MGLSLHYQNHISQHQANIFVALHHAYLNMISYSKMNGKKAYHLHVAGIYHIIS
uniref:Uncharacterized protein n=1 Tax=Anguilla anguilla TaxID=7936 RepID=A0A0E9XCN5_ANGAN